MYVNYNKWALDLWQQAFPDKRVVLNHLGKTCFENSRSTRTQIKSEYTVAETDGVSSRRASTLLAPQSRPALA